MSREESQGIIQRLHVVHRQATSTSVHSIHSSLAHRRTAVFDLDLVLNLLNRLEVAD